MTAADLTPCQAGLRNTYEKLNAALGAVSEAIAWTNDSGDVAWCNPAFESLTGFVGGQILGAPLVQLLPLYCGAEPIAPEAHPVRIAIQGEIVDTATFDFFREGMPRILELSTRLVRDIHGSKSVVVTTHDITHVHDREYLLFEQRLFLKLLQCVTEASNDADFEATALHTVLELTCRQTGWPLRTACIGDSSVSAPTPSICNSYSARYDLLRKSIERDSAIIAEMGQAARALARPHFRQFPSGSVASVMGLTFSADAKSSPRSSSSPTPSSAATTTCSTAGANRHPLDRSLREG